MTFVRCKLVWRIWSLGVRAPISVRLAHSWSLCPATNRTCSPSLRFDLSPHLTNQLFKSVHTPLIVCCLDVVANQRQLAFFLTVLDRHRGERHVADIHFRGYLRARPTFLHLVGTSDMFVQADGRRTHACPFPRSPRGCRATPTHHVVLNPTIASVIIANCPLLHG